MAKPVVLLDLDRMLYNTDQFTADLGQVLRRSFKIDPQEFSSSYAQFYAYNGEMRHYDFFGHMHRYGLDDDLVERTIETALAGKEYTYPDVADFIAFIRPYVSQLMVLTHGEHRFQYLKFSLSAVLHGLPFKDVLTHKREYIAARFAGQSGYLIDDHRVGELPGAFEHIWLSRYHAEGAYHSLEEVKDLFVKHHSIDKT